MSACQGLKIYAGTAARIVLSMANKTPQAHITIQKHGRVWAVYHGSDLLALVVYKKGANAVKELIEKLAYHADKHPTK
jgi:hypothetical protein